MLSGNRGEWTETYVFLKLLADGKLYAADINLNPIEEVYYPIIKINRIDNGRSRQYSLNGKVIIIEGGKKEVLGEIPIQDFKNNAFELLTLIKKSTGRSFQLPAIEKFLKSIDISTIKSSKQKKSDIEIIVHDLHTGLKPELGFSIKSMLGKDATLFNAGDTTNFIYELIGPNIKTLEIEKINKIIDKPKIETRLKKLENEGYKLKFHKIESLMFQLNLQLIDNALPTILSNLLLLKYLGVCSPKLLDLLDELKKLNPLGFDLSKNHPFYEYKIKSFLTDTALGMTPAALWRGQYCATGGMIVVKKSGEVLCYHIYNRSEFQDYLLNNTRLEQADTTKYNFGKLYREDSKVFIKLNLQVRFK